MAKRQTRTLIFGIALVLLGGLFFIPTLFPVSIGWPLILKIALAGLLMWGGLTRLLRHFTWSEAELLSRPGKAGLLSGIFWTSVGALILGDALGFVDGWSSFTSYWPSILILMGLGKVIDFFRLETPVRVRAAEVVGLILIVCLGLLSGRIERAHFRLIDFGAGSVFPRVWEQVLVQEHRFQMGERLEAGGIETVEVTNSYGRIRIDSAHSESVEIELEKVVRDRSEEDARALAEKFTIATVREGSVLRIGTNRKQLGRKGQRLRTHLSIKVPKTVALTVRNDYGDTRVSNIGRPCRLESTYGNVYVESVVGDLEVTNSYKGIEIRDVIGTVDARSRHGSIVVQKIVGSTHLESSYDRITARDIDGDLEARNHFGQIRVEDVTGQVTVQGSGSEVDVSDVQKSVSIQNSYKKVSAQQLGDGLDLATSYSEVSLSNIKGFLDVKATFADLAAEDIGAGATIVGRGSKVSLAQVGGPVKVGTSFKAVVIERVSGPVEVENEYGKISITVSSPLLDPITASNSYGEISLSLPADSGFTLTARAKGGQVLSDFPGPEDESKGSLDLIHGQGVPQIQLRTTHSKIRIRQKG